MENVTTKNLQTLKAESELIRHVRLSRSVSRIDLARQMSLAPSTVGVYVDRLLNEGYLLEQRKAVRAAGRPPTILELEPKAGEFIGVDFEASQIVVTSVDFSQRILQQRVSRILSSDSAERVIEKIEAAIAAIDLRYRLLGIGVGVPGIVDNKKAGMALHYEHIRGWKNIALAERLSDRFQVPVHVENNIRAMAFAEQWFGAARGIDDFVCVGVRSGIGAGVVVNGQLHRGQDDLAGEIGGWPCEAGPGHVLTLEQVASVRSLLDQLTEAVHSGASNRLVLTRNRVLLEEMLRAAHESDPLVLELLRRAAHEVGRVITQLSLLLNPKKVILAGPLASLDDAFLRPVRETAERLTPAIHSQVPEIVASQFGKYGGSLGAAALAVHQWQPSR